MSDPDLEPLRRALAARVQHLTPAGGGVRGHPQLPALTLFRADAPSGSLCGIYEPGVALVLQGSKRVVIGGDTLLYGSGQYLLTSLQLPAAATILEASADRPYLALVLRLDLREISSLLLSGTLPPQEETHNALRDGRAMRTGTVTLPLLDAFARLLALLEEPQHIGVLGALVQREIHYRLLVGEHGPQLRRMAAVGSQSRQVARAVAHLKTHYAQALRVEDLARDVRMSLSSFHQHFKALTAMSPLQYQKQLRLTEARRLMLSERCDAATAAYRVGYESASQFSREYSRQFGAPPMRDIAVLRALPAGEAVQAA